MRIAFQTFNVASTWLPKNYNLESNIMFNRMMKHVMENNDYIILGLQEARKDVFVKKYKELVEDKNWRCKRLSLKEDLSGFQKIAETFMKSVGAYQNVQLYCLEKIPHVGSIIEEARATFCKKRCGFKKSFFKGAIILDFEIGAIKIVVINTHFYYKAKKKEFGLQTRKEQMEELFNYLIANYENLDQRVVILMGDLNFRFKRSPLNIKGEDPLTKAQLEVYLNKVKQQRSGLEKEECFDELCQHLKETVYMNETKTKIYNGFLKSLKLSKYPITCRFKKHDRNLQTLESFQNFSLQKGGIRRDPSNCDKLVYFIPEILETRVRFEFNNKKAFRVPGSDHLFMNYGSLVFSNQEAKIFTF